MGKSCFFAGHREVGEELRPTLAEAVERQITQYRATDFTVGQYGGFDRLATGVLRAAKKGHPEISIFLLLPYYPTRRFVEVPEGMDGIFYLPGMERVPKRQAIVRANRYMVAHSDFLIAYAWHPASNARELVEYALSRQKRGLIQVENLAWERLPVPLARKQAKDC